MAAQDNKGTKINVAIALLSAVTAVGGSLLGVGLFVGGEEEKRKAIADDVQKIWNGVQIINSDVSEIKISVAQIQAGHGERINSLEHRVLRLERDDDT